MLEGDSGYSVFGEEREESRRAKEDDVVVFPTPPLPVKKMSFGGLEEVIEDTKDLLEGVIVGFLDDMTRVRGIGCRAGERKRRGEQRDSMAVNAVKVKAVGNFMRGAFRGHKVKFPGYTFINLCKQQPP